MARPSLRATGTALLITCTIAVLFLCSKNVSIVSAQDHSMDSQQMGHEGMSMPMDGQTTMDAAQMKEMMADKEGSEFNHHLAGFFVILAGFLILSEGALPPSWSFLRFAWAFCFLASGIFLLIAIRNSGHSVPRVGPTG
jgi:hypothetical protein